LPTPPEADGQLPFLTAATPAFFEIMGVQILEGRSFTTEDDRGAPVVIVNESMARGTWPGDGAVGKCIRIGFDPDFDPFTGPDHRFRPPLSHAGKLSACRNVHSGAQCLASKPKWPLR